MAGDNSGNPGRALLAHLEAQLHRCVRRISHPCSKRRANPTPDQPSHRQCIRTPAPCSAVMISSASSSRSCRITRTALRSPDRETRRQPPGKRRRTAYSGRTGTYRESTSCCRQRNGLCSASCRRRKPRGRQRRFNCARYTSFSRRGNSRWKRPSAPIVTVACSTGAPSLRALSCATWSRVSCAGVPRSR